MSCVARPSAALIGRLGIMYPERGLPESGTIVGILDDIVAVDALGAILTEGFKLYTKADGSCDERDIGAYVVGCMIKDGNALRPKLSLVGGPMTPKDSANVEAAAVDMMAAAAMGRLIIRAVNETQEKGTGLTHMQKVAVFIFRTINEAKR